MTYFDDYENNMLTAAIEYVSAGLSIVDIERGHKAPRTLGWNKAENAISDQDEVSRVFRYGEHNIGILHDASHTFCLDIDDLTETIRWFKSTSGIDLLQLVTDHACYFGNPDNRLKVLFRLPADVEPFKTRKLVPANTRNPIFEIRCKGAQDVAPGSLHPDGYLYQWNEQSGLHKLKEAPDSIIDLVLNFDDIVEPKRPAAISTASIESDYRARIDRFNREISIIDILERNGYIKKDKRYLSPWSSTGLAGVDVFPDDNTCNSFHGSCPLNDGKGKTAFDAFMILEHGGDFNAAYAAIAHLEPKANVIPLFDALQDKAQDSGVDDDVDSGVDIPELPIDRLPGVLGEFADWVTATAIMPQPDFANVAALSLAAAALAQKFKSSTGVRTNLYLFTIGLSGAGKEHPMNCVRDALERSGLAATRLAGDDVKSGPGVLRAVSKTPKGLFILDEFGKMMKAAKNVNNSHLAQALDQFLRLYSKTNTVVRGAMPANPDMNEQIVAHYPCASLYAATTPATFYSHLSMEHVESGFVGRNIFIESTYRPRRFDNRSNAEVPESVIEWLKAVDQLPVHNGNLADINPGYYTIDINVSDDAIAVFNAFDDKMYQGQCKLDEKGLAEALTRCVENAYKIALILAMTRYEKDNALPVIEKQDAHWACNFVSKSANTMLSALEHHSADSRFEENWQTVLKVINKSGVNGVTHRDLLRAKGSSRFSTKELDDILNYLRSAQRIGFFAVRTRTKHKNVYVAENYFQQLQAIPKSVTGSVIENESQ